MHYQEKETAMYERVRQWKESGKSQRQFCSDAGIPPHQLSYWARKLQSLGNRPTGFVPVTVQDSTEGQPVTPRIEIVLDGDLIIRVY